MFLGELLRVPLPGKRRSSRPSRLSGVDEATPSSVVADDSFPRYFYGCVHFNESVARLPPMIGESATRRPGPSRRPHANTPFLPFHANSRGTTRPNTTPRYTSPAPSTPRAVSVPLIAGYVCFKPHFYCTFAYIFKQVRFSSSLPP